MKKALFLLAVVAMLVSLCACGGSNQTIVESSEKNVFLTVENVDSYLDVIAKVESCTTSGLVSITSGDAKISVKTLNNSGAKFKDVQIAVKVTAQGGQFHGWEFTSGNKPSEVRDDESAMYYERHSNSKTIYNMKLSYEGETDAVLESLKFKKYIDKSVLFGDKLDDSSLKVEIIDVRGSVEIE